MVFEKLNFHLIILLLCVRDVHDQPITGVPSSDYLKSLNFSWTNIRDNKSKLKTILYDNSMTRNKSGYPETYINPCGTIQKGFISMEGICKAEHVRVGILNFPQVASYDPITNSYTGFSVDLLEELSQRLNFTYSLMEPGDHQWGAFKNGTWNGLVGKLVANEYDLVVAPLTRHSGREQVIDMVCSTSREEYKLWILNPEKRPDKSFIIIDLMDTEGPIQIFVASIKRTRFLAPWCEEDRINMGSNEVPKSVSRRTVLAFWWWFSILVSVMYSGTIVAHLSDGRPAYPFKSIGEMLKQNVYQYGIVGNSVVETILQESKSPYHRQLLESIRQFAKTDPVVMSTDLGEHLRKMKEERYVFIGSIHNATSTFAQLKEGLTEEWCCLGLPKHSPLKKPLKRVLYDLWQYGILQALWRKYGILKSQPTLEEDTEESNTIDLSLYSMQSAFKILISGVLISGITLFGEILIHIY